MIDSVVAAAVYAGMTLDDDDFEHFGLAHSTGRPMERASEPNNG